MLGVICTNEFLTRLDFPHHLHRQLEFLLGFILGGLFIAFVAVYGFGEEEEPEKQYVEIKTEQGRIPVYIGMPKDSVLSFMGKPDRASMSTVGSTVMEDWKYDGDLSTDMPGTHFHFVDGEMSSVTQIHY